MTAALDTYAELRLAEGKLLRWGERDRKAEVALQARDLEILVALARYRFLTTGQIAELWWEGRGLRAVRRRMTRLFDAGFVERFRPQTLRGSYQWTYCLARDGFRAAQQTGELADGLKFAPRREAIFDYRYVIHDLRTNEWVLRYRELLGDRLLDWAGPDESRFEPPKKRRDEEHLDRATAVLSDCGWYANDVADEEFRPVQPDALLDVAAGGNDVRVFVEYDRTRRVDKNSASSCATRPWSSSGGARRSSAVRTSSSSARTPSTSAASSTPRTPSSPATSATERANTARSATSHATARCSSSRATSATARPRRWLCRLCRRVTRSAPARRTSDTCPCRGSKREINTP